MQQRAICIDGGAWRLCNEHMGDLETNFDGLRVRLNQLHRAVGRPTYRQLRDQAALAGYRLPTSTCHELLTGSRMPRWATVEAFIVACMGHADSRRPPIPVPAQCRDLPTWQKLYDEAEQDFDHRDGTNPRATRPGQANRGPDQWQIYMDFALSVNTAHNALRMIAHSQADAPNLHMDANQAVDDSGLYAEREKLLAAGSPDVVIAGEPVFLQLIAVRDAIRNGAELASVEYHRAYRPFGEALWTFRMAVRAEFGQTRLTPETLSQSGRFEDEPCADCVDFG